MNTTKSRSWKRLDNAAKIFPPNSNRRDTKVFRFSCGLKEKVDEETLQQAVDKAITDFPLYTSIIRKGLFWYYFESTDMKPVVREEYKPPCSALFDGNVKTLLFEVTYYRNTIHLEIYHALTDGAGALQFLRNVVLQYVLIKYQDTLVNSNPTLDYDASQTQREDDSFSKYFNNQKAMSLKKEKTEKACKIHGEKQEEYILQVINGVMSAKAVLQEAKKYQTTLTVFLCSVLICAIARELSVRERRHPIVISVPVNLRAYFKSASARNFFSVVRVGHTFGSDEIVLEDVIRNLNDVFIKELKTERFQASLDKHVAFEQSYITRFVPLFLKTPTLRIVHYFNHKGITSSLSNVGRIKIGRAHV